MWVVSLDTFCLCQVRDVTFCVDPESGLAALLVMSSSGHVYTQYLDEDSKAVHGPFYITSSMDISHPLITKVRSI